MNEASQTGGRAVPFGLPDRLRSAHTMTSELLSDVIDQAGLHRSTRIERLIRSSALVDAALALIEQELPQWRLRRLTYDEGEWHCALSRCRELPDWLDQAIESSHADLSLALLCVAVDALQIGAPSMKTSVPGIPYIDPLCAPLCCDNFA